MASMTGMTGSTGATAGGPTAARGSGATMAAPAKDDERAVQAAARGARGVRAAPAADTKAAMATRGASVDVDGGA